MSPVSVLTVLLAGAVILLGLGACDDGARTENGPGESHAEHLEGEGLDDHDGHGEHADEDYERGPNGGRLLRHDGFALEITIFETGVEPEFRVYAYNDGEIVSPATVRLRISLGRLGGQVDDHSFVAQENFLRGSAVVEEPHSFDVTVRAEYGGEAFEWVYESHEGRTVIDPAQAEAAGIGTEMAGPARIDETVTLSGRIELQPRGRADVTAWYPGRVTALTKDIGDPVTSGEIIARVLSSESLQTYEIAAPISGVVISRNVNVGDVADSDPLYVIADSRLVRAEFIVYPLDADRLRPGQPITIRSLTGSAEQSGTVSSVLPTTEAASQTLIMHMELANDDGTWRPGQAVEGIAIVASSDVPLAVRTRALQRFRDFTVVFANVGDTYEVRMLELGRQTKEWTEVLGGLEPGTNYVTDNAFLIRADIEKSGAGHDH
ncbi:MAG TPA: efflux RND transporter periplasmic adaptor subunit [Hyphomonas sp.]|nr:efflux RND transporter periplasmic adaptor subunit [Hyphomonas sp.]